MPFWRKQGLNGFVLSLDDEFHVVLDNSPSESSCGVLVGFLEAAQARTAAEMTGGERRKLITSTLVIYFGARAAEQFGIVERGLNGRGVHPLLLRGHVGDGRVDRCGKRAARSGAFTGLAREAPMCGTATWRHRLWAPRRRRDPRQYPAEPPGAGQRTTASGGCPLDHNSATTDRIGTIMALCADAVPAPLGRQRDVKGAQDVLKVRRCGVTTE